MDSLRYKCSKCPETFNSRGKRDSHGDRFHRSEVTITFKDGSTLRAGRNSDGWFQCPCGKTYSHTRELVRHSKGCNRGAVEPAVTSGRRPFCRINFSDHE